MPFATINGIRIHYLVQGTGPHLLMFAPGGFRSVISRWTAQGGKREWQEMDGLAALSRHFTCIAYDRRESGLSGGRVEPLSWDLYVLTSWAAAWARRSRWRSPYATRRRAPVSSCTGLWAATAG
jgi:pimeloyl-ACP methyl ester carboxylesterase